MYEKKSTILVVDDDMRTQKMLRIFLESGPFKSVECTSGKQAVRMCISLKPDVILLSLDLPDMEGMAVITAIREWSEVPIIVVSHRSDDDTIIATLDIGANDYVTKPFNIGVLLARIGVALRTTAVREAGTPELRNGPLRMDLVRHEVFINNVRQAFTPKEYDLLRHFMVNRGKMMTHREILKKVWGEGHTDDTAYLRVYIGQIREKIEVDTAFPVFITTEPGVGYRMDAI